MPTYLPEEDRKPGRIGVDARGMVFMVLDARNVVGHREETRFDFVTVLPGGRHGIPGTCLHYSWVEMPVTWAEIGAVGGPDIRLARPGEGPTSVPVEDPRITAAKAQGCCGRMAARGPKERCSDCPLPRGGI